TWTAEEVSSLLDPRDAAIFDAAYGVEANGNARPESDPHRELEGRNTLYRAKSDAELGCLFDCPETEIRERLAAARKILLERRATRPPPHRDDKIVTAWNGLAIGALARGARVMQRPDLAPAAREAAAFLKRELCHGGKLFRSHRGRRGEVEAFPADYAFLISGLIELHATRPDEGWLTWAAELQEKLDDMFWSEPHAGYVMRPSLAGDELLAIRDDYDGAEPSPNHVAAENLLKLATLLDEPRHAARAEALLHAGTAMLERQSFACPLLLAALDLHERGAMHFKIPAGTDPTIAAKIHTHFLPRVVFSACEGDRVIVCEGMTCRPFDG
ncbi:MAG TPA: hypothetical protein VLO11_13865, partial [Luteolibacter sp.]|nr:hypothetical protein [Luteolibacter sp.]